MNNLLQNLNEKQKEAVLTTEGPVMAIAGAGSGKTSVLTKRIAYLINEIGVDPESILALTFTNKAAKEMKDRIIDTPEYEFDRAPSWVSTFHAMCVRILRQHHEAINYRRNFQILDDDDTLQKIKSIAKDLQIDSKVMNAKEIKDKVSKFKMNRIDLEILDAGEQVIVKNVYDRYQISLRRNHLMDFNDLLLLTIELFETNEVIRSIYEKKFQYVLIDEFQDTNDIQYKLVQLIMGKNQNLFIVGDEDQSIYKFRGANIKNIRKFQKDYPKHHIVLLEQNYRSTNTILKAANNVISNNKQRIPKNLFSKKIEGSKITMYKATTSRDEVEYVAMEILKQVRKGYKYNDFAILYRINSASRAFEDVFLQKHIPYRIYGNTSFFKRKEIKDLTAYLRLILESDDEVTFERVITTPKRGIGKKTIDKLIEFKLENNYTMFEAIEHGSGILGKSAYTKLLNFVELINKFKQNLQELPFEDFIDLILTESGYLESLEKDEKKDIRIENLLEFKNMLYENEQIYLEYSREEMLMFLLEEVTLKSEEKNSDIEDGVTMLSLHAAKGLEFRVVFIVNMENNIFPTSRAINAGDISEERRLMYVGVTRAKEKLYLTNSNVRMTFGETARTQDSVFIDEIGEKLLEVKGYSELINKPHGEIFKITKRKQEVINKKRKNIDNYQENELNKGDKVNHTTFGKGVVITVSGDNCTIAFSAPHGLKTLLKNHKAISKI